MPASRFVAATSPRRAIGRAKGILFALLLACPAVARGADEIHWTFTGPTSVAFDWRGCDGTIRYGLTSAYGLEAVARPPTPAPFSSPGPFWEVELTGLRENTAYHYSIDGGPDHLFHTPPPKGSSGFSIYVEGDIGDSLSYWRMAQVQTMIAAGAPDFVLCIGDLTYGTPNGMENVDGHFNDVMKWSQDAAYMPAWGNHEWESPQADDLRNYKGRFRLPNPRGALGSPAAGCCDEDWYWFDYGNVRFIAYPEPYAAGVWQDWAADAAPIFDQAQADPDIRFIVTFGHQPAYSSGEHLGSSTLASLMAQLAAGHSKYVLNVNGHSHDYERSYPQSGVTHVTSGTGGADLEQQVGACLWKGGCPPPAWSAFRAMHHVAFRLDFRADGIHGTAFCGPAGDVTKNVNDVTCTQGAVLDSFTIGSMPAVATWFVDGSHAGCSDAGPGSDVQPYCTISAAVAAHAGPDAVVHVRPGTYREEVTLASGGTAGHPFVLEGERGAVIDGADDFSGAGTWQPYFGPVWRTSAAPWNPVQVLVDGARLARYGGPPPATPENSFSWSAGVLYVNLGGDDPGAHATRVSHRAHGISVTGSGIRVAKLEIRDTQGAALALSGAGGARLVGNTITHAGGGGISVTGGTAATLDSNQVMGSLGHGISIGSGATGARVRGNDVSSNAVPAGSPACGVAVSAATGTLLSANRLHHNQGDGARFELGADGVSSDHDCAWGNGGAGFAAVGSAGASCAGDVAWGNSSAGFSFETSPGGSLANSIAVDNGAGSGYDLRVDAASVSGFHSDYNVLWNSAATPLAEYGGASYASLLDYGAASGQDAHSTSADPRFARAILGDFHLLAGSPAIDSGDSGAPGGDLDAEGYGYTDDPGALDQGTGPVAFGDRGALEYRPPQHLGSLIAAPATGTEALLVTLDASGSVDPAGGFASYEFDFGDGQTLAAQPQPILQHAYAAGIWLATVRAIDAEGRVGMASAFVVAAPQAAGANLASNPSFEDNAAGWSSYAAQSIQRTAGGFDGAWSMKLAGPASLAVFGLNDSPNVIGGTVAGVRYRYSAWVRSPGGGGTVRFRVQELYGGAAVAPRRESAPVRLSCLWQQVTLDVPANLTGSSLDCQIVNTPLLHGETFYVDQVSVRVVTDATTGVPADSLRMAPLVPVLAPNPMAQSAVLRFATSRAGPLRVDVYDIAGRRVRTWLDEARAEAGVHTLRVDGRLASGGKAGAGLYFYRVTAAEGTVTRRFLVIR